MNASATSNNASLLYYSYNCMKAETKSQLQYFSLLQTQSANDFCLHGILV